MAYTIQNLFQIYGREKSLERILKATKELRKYIKLEKEAGLSEKGRLIKERCIALGPSGNHYAVMFGIILGEDLGVKDHEEKYPFIQFACISLNSRMDNHDYKTGEPFFMLTSDTNTKDANTICGIKLDGRKGKVVRPLVRIINILSDEEVIKAVNMMFDLLVEKGISDQGFGKEEKEGKGTKEMDFQ